MTARPAHLEASHRCGAGLVLHASSAGYAAHSEGGALSIKTMRGGAAHYALGRARLRVDDQHYALLQDGQPYAVEVAPDTESFCLFFEPGATRGLWQLARTRPDALLDLPELPPAPDFIQRSHSHDGLLSPLLNTLRAGNLGGRWTADEWDDHLLRVLTRLYALHTAALTEAGRLPAARPATRLELARRLHRARDFMEAGLHEPLPLERVAEIAHLSPYHFHRAFRDLFRETPAQYVTRRRLETARHLLRTTALSVLDISLAVGFQTPEAFSTLFRRRTGQPPSAWRGATPQD